MHKRYLLIPLILAGSVTAFGQVSNLQHLNAYYQKGLELLEKEKYIAASEQFKMVDKNRLKSWNQQESSAQLGLLKENAKFYAAVCALELGNADAESLFEQFIRDYPLNPNTKLAYFHMGRTYFNRQDFSKALEWFEKTDPSTLSLKERTEYQFKQAYAYFQTNEIDKAEPLFEEVKKEEGPYQEGAIYYFAYINYLNKEYKTALANFEKLKGSSTYEASYPYYITSMYYLDERYDDVLAYALPILKSTKQQFEPEMLSLIAASYFAKAEYKNAEQYYTAFYDKDKSNTKNNVFIYQYGYSLVENQKYEQAVKILEKLDSEDIYLQNGMNTLGKAFLKLNNKPKAQSAFYNASRLEFDKAIQEEAWFNYAKLSYELDFHQNALESTRNFLKQFPQSRRTNEAKTLLGEILLTAKNYQAAVDILEPIINESENAKEAYQKVTYFRGLEFYNERAFPNALSMFLRSERYALDEEIYALSSYWKGEAMYELRKFGESVKAFEKFLTLPGANKTPVYNYANYALAYAAFEDEKYSKAANYFERFLKGNDKDKNTVDDATLRLADAHFVNKNYGEAMANYNTIINRKTNSEDYALFQRGMIQGLQNQPDVKISTMEALLMQFPNSNYADDAGFEIAYTYFNKGQFDRAKTDLVTLVAKYPHSSYVPKALNTIGLVNYNQDQPDAALESFKKVIQDYPSSDEAKQALESIQNIYVSKGDADGFMKYAGTTPLGNYTNAEQDNIVFQAANNLYLKGNFNGAYASVNAYFDKFPKPIHDKQARFIRAESLVRMGRGDEAVQDYEYILNDWTSDYTERSLMSISKVFMDQKKYNEAIVYLKRIETTTDYKANYSYAINNLLKCYTELNSADDMLKYAQLTKSSEKASEEEINSSGLFAGKAYLLKGDTTTAIKEFRYVVANSKTVAAAEAKYQLAFLEYKKGSYKESQKICFELIKQMANHDYWVAKSFILLADNYIALKEIMQAKSTLNSLIDNYEDRTDDILSSAKERLDKLNSIK